MEGPQRYLELSRDVSATLHDIGRFLGGLVEGGPDGGHQLLLDQELTGLFTRFYQLKARHQDRALSCAVLALTKSGAFAGRSSAPASIYHLLLPASRSSSLAASRVLQWVLNRWHSAGGIRAIQMFISGALKSRRRHLICIIQKGSFWAINRCTMPRARGDADVPSIATLLSIFGDRHVCKPANRVLFPEGVQACDGRPAHDCP